MDTRFQRILVYVVIIAVLIGVGFLIYRFVQGPSSENVKTIVINRDGAFSQDEIKLDNDDVLRVRNDDDRSHTVKKVTTDTTFVEVNSRSTSRELPLPDNSRTELFLDNDEDETIAVLVGNAPVAEEDEEEAPEEETPQAVTPPDQTATQSASNLPDTGAEDLYFVPVFIAAGFVLVKLSKKILN